MDSINVQIFRQYICESCFFAFHMALFKIACQQMSCRYPSPTADSWSINTIHRPCTHMKCFYLTSKLDVLKMYMININNIINISNFIQIAVILFAFLAHSIYYKCVQSRLSSIKLFALVGWWPHVYVLVALNQCMKVLRDFEASWLWIINWLWELSQLPPLSDTTYADDSVWCYN